MPQLQQRILKHATKLQQLKVAAATAAASCGALRAELEAALRESAAQIGPRETARCGAAVYGQVSCTLHPSAGD